MFENPFCFQGCGFENLCGDRKIQFALGEQCDDGNNNNNDKCTNDCKLPRCGDGFVQSGEQCDDGNVVDGDQCSSECLEPDPDGDGFCDNGKDILPCQLDQGCETSLDCGMGGACPESTCECPGVKCTTREDCIGTVDCSEEDLVCQVAGRCEFCDTGECKCATT